MADIELRWLVLGKRKVLQMRKLLGYRRDGKWNREKRRVVETRTAVWSAWDQIPATTRSVSEGERS